MRGEPIKAAFGFDSVVGNYASPYTPGSGYVLSDGSSWDDHRETVADLMIETVDDFAPNFRRSVLARQIFSPLDLERTFGLIGGDIFHGALDLRHFCLAALVPRPIHPQHPQQRCFR